MHLADLYLPYRVLYPLYSSLSLLSSVLREAKQAVAKTEWLPAAVYSVASSS
jgi:hypothetical protein